MRLGLKKNVEKIRADAERIVDGVTDVGHEHDCLWDEVMLVLTGNLDPEDAPLLQAEAELYPDLTVEDLISRIKARRLEYNRGLARVRKLRLKAKQDIRKLDDVGSISETCDVLGRKLL